jgi:hypothetical protein
MRTPQTLAWTLLGAYTDSAVVPKRKIRLNGKSGLGVQPLAQRPVALLCVVLMVWCLLVPNAIASQSTSVPKPTLKEQVIHMPGGAVVEVKLKRKKTRMRGRLGAISDSGFELQRTINDKVVTETIAFQDVKEVKQTGKGMSQTTTVILAVGIGVALVLVVMAAFGAASLSRW